MKENLYLDFAFMLLGLGFFIAMIWMVQAWEERHYQRKINEAREFGYKNSRLEKEAFSEDPKTQKS